MSFSKAKRFEPDKGKSIISWFYPFKMFLLNF